MFDSDLTLKHSISETSSLGDRLRHSREARGLSQQEIANALCLNVDIVNALDQDTYHQMAAPVFVQGYLRNYANYLRLPLDEFLPTGKSFSPVKSKVPNPRHKIIVWISLIGHILLRLLNYAVFITLVVLIFIWWHDRHSAQEKTFSTIKMENSH